MAEGLPRLPALAPGFEVEVVAGGAIVSDPARSRAHFLNASAALVLSLCDGASSAEVVAERVQHSCDLATPPSAAVAEILIQFLREGLIADAG